MWKGTLSLQQCNGVVSKLRSLLWMSDGSTKSSIRVPDLSVTMNLGDYFMCKDFVSQIKGKLDEHDTRLQQQHLMYDSIYYLRTAIVAANCECGLNKCLSDINCAKDKLKMLKAISDQISNSYGDERTDRAYLDSLNTDFKYTLDSLVSSTRKVNVVSPLDLSRQIEALQMAISGLERERDRLNNSTLVSVEIHDSIAKLVAL
jgi:hypothetical protein